MEDAELVVLIADTLKEFDSSGPIFKNFKPGIGPFGEPQLVQNLAKLLEAKGHKTQIARTPDLTIDKKWAIEFKIARPFGDNGIEAENWSVNLLHPYRGNTSAIGDAFKLVDYQSEGRKAVLVIGYEHKQAKISLDPLLDSFELIAKDVCRLPLGKRIEERRENLVHPVHEVVRCIFWEVITAE
jgi:hypothetical protein